MIRTIVARDAGDAQIRHFDKHIFDQTGHARTVQKFIGVAHAVGEATPTSLNAWTRVFDADQDNVLGEFGMQRTYPRTTLSHNFWVNFTVESYRADLLPAAAALGFPAGLYRPVLGKRYDAKRGQGACLPICHGNMCCPHEYEVAQVLGGIEGYRKLAECRARMADRRDQSWIGSHQSRMSPYLRKHGAEVIKAGRTGAIITAPAMTAIYGMDLASPVRADVPRVGHPRGAQATGISRLPL